MTHKNFTHIQLKRETKLKLDDYRFALQKKLKTQISQNRMIDILINGDKEKNKIIRNMPEKYLEKIKALESYIERLESGERIKK